jgi:uncharacterized membrane protein YqgA involved in biofilm formation
VRGLGTLVNLATVAAGSLAGVALGDRLPARMRATILQGLGLVTIAVGVVGLEPLYDAQLGLRRFIITIGAVITGGIVGELLDLEGRLERLGEALRRRFGVRDADGDLVHVKGHSRFAEGFVLASTVFCVGPLTILGAVEDGLGISVRLLAIKSALDGFASVGFASVYGWGVAASLLTIAVYQGALTAGAALIADLITPEVIAQFGAIGSLLIIGIALRLLELKAVRVVNLLPAVLIGALAAGLIPR